MNATKWMASQLKRLMGIKDSPHAVALGVAVGIFFGFMPLVGLKTLLALGLTRLMRGSLIAAVIAVTLHDVLLPIAPFLMRWEYDLGYWLMSHPHVLPPHLQLHVHGPSTWLHWSTFLTVGRPLLIGSLVLAVPASIASYYLTLLWKNRAHRHAANPPKV